jgi:hypothetical protein
MEYEVHYYRIDILFEPDIDIAAKAFWAYGISVFVYDIEFYFMLALLDHGKSYPTGHRTGRMHTRHLADE